MRSPIPEKSDSTLIHIMARMDYDGLVKDIAAQKTSK